MITTDPKILSLAFLGGIIPALFWLWFWLREDRKHPEPKGLVGLVFLMGMLAVIVVLPLQRMIQSFNLPANLELTTWASAEEMMKLIFVLIVVSSTRQADEPTDWPIYLITIALGFSALENSLFLLKPLSLGQTTVSLLTGQLRFLGATLLHTVSSGIIGIAMGLSFYGSNFNKKMSMLFGIILAITLHSIFNFFIMKNGGSDFLKVFSFLWVIVVIVMLIFEKLRRMNP